MRRLSMGMFERGEKSKMEIPALIGVLIEIRKINHVKIPLGTTLNLSSHFSNITSPLGVRVCLPN